MTKLARTTKDKQKNDYVDNKRFYEALIKYNEDLTEWIINCDSLKNKNDSRNLPNEPRIPEYIGKCIYLIANNLKRSFKFSGYSYNDEMVGDAIEDAIKRIKSFDPKKSNNPFAYFTQICYFAMVRRIKAEKKQSKLKNEIIKNTGILNDIIMNVQDQDDGDYTNNYINFLMENIDEEEKVIYNKQTTLQYQNKQKELKNFIETEEETIIENSLD
jgi:hypothetical protein